MIKKIKKIAKVFLYISDIIFNEVKIKERKGKNK